MCTINFVREFGLMMEEARKEYLGCRERMLWIALFYIANDRARYNPQTQTYEWPTDFFQISHQELDLYCKLNKKAVLELRNRLKQKGYIDFAKGERNAEKPMYKLNYLSLRYFGGENAPKEDAKAGTKEGPKAGTKAGPNTDTKAGPLSPKYKQGICTAPAITPEKIHTEPPCGEESLPARGSAERFDAAWKTSERARGAVAQRILNGCGNPRIHGAFLHGYIMDALRAGLAPETIAEMAAEAESASAFQARMLAASQRVPFALDA